MASKGWSKARKLQKVPETTRPQLTKGEPKASNSQRRVGGEQVSESTRNHSPSTRNGEQYTREASYGG